RETHAHGHTQHLFGAFDHALHEVCAPREHGARMDALEEARLFETPAHLVEDLFAAGFHDIAQESSRNAPRGVTTYARHLHLFLAGDHASERAPIVPLQALSLAGRGPKPCGQVARDVVAANGNHTRVGDRTVRVENDVRCPATDIDHDDADLFLVVA